MIRVIIRPAAKEDIQEASDWYEGEEPGLGGGPRGASRERDRLLRW
jgi:hypothetical protein